MDPRHYLPLPVPEPGLVISYSYLWRSEYEQDREEGPCAVILIAADATGGTVVTLVPITHNPLQHPGDGVEIPPA